MKTLNIFEYTDYRKFLLDYYNEQKAINKSFSYQYFANKADFKSKSFIKLVIDGKKNLTPDSIRKINNVLKLNEKSFSYFSDLVAFNQENSVHKRNYYFQKILQYNKRSLIRKVLNHEFEIYSKWYFNAIRELVVLLDFKDNYEKLGKMLVPPISSKQAREAVLILQKAGFINKIDGKYYQKDSLITTGDQIKSLAISNFHIQNLKLAEESIETMQSDIRDISTLVLGLSHEGFNVVREEISKFRKKLLDIADYDKKINRVYHVNFQLVPVSEEIGKND